MDSLDALNRIDPAVGLPPTNWLGNIRRYFGLYNKSEREVLSYARNLKSESIKVAQGTKVLLDRPEWMRHEDYRKLRTLQNKIDRRRRGKGLPVKRKE